MRDLAARLGSPGASLASAVGDALGAPPRLPGDFVLILKNSTRPIPYPSRPPVQTFSAALNTPSQRSQPAKLGDQIWPPLMAAFTGPCSLAGRAGIRQPIMASADVRLPSTLERNGKKT
jgi:hypothetical protein